MITRTTITGWFTAQHIKITIALFVLLLVSAGGHALQHYSAARAAAECTAAAATQAAELATATAEAERLRNEQVSTLTLLLANDANDTVEALQAIDRRIRQSTDAYRAAQAANPDPCRASADRVRAVNAARGVQ